MHVTLPAGDGREMDCPHQFVGRCEACTAAASGQGIASLSVKGADGDTRSGLVSPGGHFAAGPA